VREAVDLMNSSKRRFPFFIDEKKALDIFNRVSESYVKQLSIISRYINDLSSFVPQRRKRVLHVGLFGYSRSSGGIKLPRAIKFTASISTNIM
jgi:phosphoenolpyruvate carboxylase